MCWLKRARHCGVGRIAESSQAIETGYTSYVYLPLAAVVRIVGPAIRRANSSTNSMRCCNACWRCPSIRPRRRDRGDQRRYPRQPPTLRQEPVSYRTTEYGDDELAAVDDEHRTRPNRRHAATMRMSPQPVKRQEDADNWVPLSSTWKPSPHTWKPLAQSWQQPRTRRLPAGARIAAEPRRTCWGSCAVIAAGCPRPAHGERRQPRIVQVAPKPPAGRNTVRGSRSRAAAFPMAAADSVVQRRLRLSAAAVGSARPLAAARRRRSLAAWCRRHPPARRRRRPGRPANGSVGPGTTSSLEYGERARPSLTDLGESLDVLCCRVRFSQVHRQRDGSTPSSRPFSATCFPASAKSIRAVSPRACSSSSASMRCISTACISAAARHTIEGKTYRVSSNVYLPDTADRPGGNPFGLPRRWPISTIGRSSPASSGSASPPGRPSGSTSPTTKTPRTAVFPSAASSAHRARKTSTPSTIGGTKLIELGWVYTVIAGVLNIMVIYDAFAGPAFLAHAEPKKEGHA